MKLRILFVTLICMVFFGHLFSVSAVGEVSNTVTGTINLMSYNVHGLALPGDAKIKVNSLAIGSLLNNFDFVAVQEDFNFHSALIKNVTLPYKTVTSGFSGVGDGLNFYSAFPIYNEGRVRWNDAYGIFTDGSDELTPKGILYCTIEVAKGVYVDVYNMHADAYDEEGSVAARRSNLAQLAKLINEKSANRSVIVLGDSNSRFSTASDKLNELLLKPCGLKDAWVEVVNGGILPTAQDAANHPNWWGYWDSVDKVMYRNGGGAELKALTHEYVYNLNPKTGESYSDHAATQVTIQYTATPAPNSLDVKNFDYFALYFTSIKSFFHSFGILFTGVGAFLTGTTR